MTRDILMQFASDGLVQARWTELIHSEWMAALIKLRPDIPGSAVERLRLAMDAAVPDALLAGFEHLIERFDLPDPDDRHVAAAALHCGASVIVTQNLRDFPDDALAPFGLRALHPDDFISERIEAEPIRACRGIRTMRLRWKKPAYDAYGMLGLFDRQGLAKAGALLRPLVDRL